MKVRAQTRDRLELVHRPMVPLIIGGLGIAGAGYYGWLTTDGWKRWSTLVICTLIGLVMVGISHNSTVVFDRRRGRAYVETSHRYLFKRSTDRWPLGLVSDIVLAQDRMVGSVLTVICIKIGPAEIPITMFGTPFPAAAFKYGVLISDFLELPLRERDRLIADTLEGKAQDALQDAWGRGVSRYVLDGPDAPSNPAVSLGCPTCRATQRIVGREDLADLHRTTMTCERCGTVMRIDAGEILAG